MAEAPPTSASPASAVQLGTYFSFWHDLKNDKDSATAYLLDLLKIVSSIDAGKEPAGITSPLIRNLLEDFQAGSRNGSFASNSGDNERVRTDSMARDEPQKVSSPRLLNFFKGRKKGDSRGSKAAPLTARSGPLTARSHVSVKSVSPKGSFGTDDAVICLAHPDDVRTQRQISVNTMLYILLNHSVDWSNTALTEQANEWCSANNMPGRLGLVEQTLKSAMSSGDGSLNLISLVEECSNIDDADPQEAVAHSFIFPVLRGYAKNGRLKEIVDACLIILQHPLITEARLATLLHLLSALTSEVDSVDQELAATLVTKLKKFYLWPKPIGSLVARVLNNLRQPSKPLDQQPKTVHVFCNLKSEYGALFKTMFNDWTTPNSKLMFQPWAMSDKSTVRASGALTHTNSSALIELIIRGRPAGTTDMNLDVCLAGGDGTIHHFLAGYCGLILEKPDLVATCNMRFFVAPLGGHNTLATFMALFDGWYRRHVYEPFRLGFPLCPQLESCVDTKIPEVDASARGGPAQILRNNVDQYLSTSDCSLDLAVFQSECWLGDIKDPLSGKPTYSVFITHWMEISMASFEAMNPGEKYPGVNVHLSFQTMSVVGEERKKEETMNLHAFELRLGNVRRDSDDAAVNPSQPWLAMMLREVDQKKKMRASEVPIERLVSWIDIRADSPFCMTVDGEQYGPFSRCKVSALRNPKTNAHVTIPVSTFLPSRDL